MVYRLCSNQGNRKYTTCKTGGGVSPTQGILYLHRDSETEQINSRK